MPRWLPRLLKRMRDLARVGRVRFTLKATRELTALDAGLDVQDACGVLAGLISEDFVERFVSVSTGEWMYVFKPAAAGRTLYVKVLLRAECLVVSFHEDDGETQEDEGG